MNPQEIGKAIYISHEVVSGILRQAPLSGKHLLEPLKSFAVEHDLPLKVLEVHESEYEAEIHKTVQDLWYCLEGEARFLIGGSLVDPWQQKNPDGSENSNELRANSIRGGGEAVLLPGDWLWIPAGEAHQHKTKGTARLVIIRLKA